MRNAIVLGWKRSIAGREHAASVHLTELASYLAKLEHEGTIRGFETFLLDPHGGCQGFFVVHGNVAQLDLLQNHETWIEHVMRAGLHLEDVFAIRAATGDEAAHMMDRWGKLLPASPA